MPFGRRARRFIVNVATGADTLAARRSESGGRLWTTERAPPSRWLEATLADRFDLAKSRVLLNGAQAVARLLLSQKARDRRAGLNTGGFVSGYRGSPLGGLDQQFFKIAGLFADNDIHFEPGLNDKLAATAIWGAQQAELRGEGRFDGVFGLWYGKARASTARATRSATRISAGTSRMAAFWR